MNNLILSLELHLYLLSKKPINPLKVSAKPAIILPNVENIVPIRSKTVPNRFWKRAIMDEKTEKMALKIEVTKLERDSIREGMFALLRGFLRMVFVCRGLIVDARDENYDINSKTMVLIPMTLKLIDYARGCGAHFITFTRCGFELVMTSRFKLSLSKSINPT